MPENFFKTLGSAHYEARWIARSNLVRLTASGILPCSNYSAQLEKRPERVIPPMWNFVFYVEDSCDKALLPFSQSVVMVNGEGRKNILVHDATGIQEVPILQANEPSLNDEKTHVVYARLPKEEGRLSGCQVAAADTLLNAYHYKAFGPASLAACEEFLQKHGAENQQIAAPSGEIPWPLMS
jgi:hypothetical protein